MTDTITAYAITEDGKEVTLRIEGNEVYLPAGNWIHAWLRVDMRDLTEDECSEYRIICEKGARLVTFLESGGTVSYQN